MVQTKGYLVTLILGTGVGGDGTAEERKAAENVFRNVADFLRKNWPPEEGKIRFAVVDVAVIPQWRQLGRLEAKAEDLQFPVLVCATPDDLHNTHMICYNKHMKFTY
jgi:hypothetical protein